MKIRTWHIIGAAFTAVLGTLLHFAYEWSGFNPVFAVFGAVNESVWEHLKLIYWPAVVFAFAEYWIYGKNVCGFFTAKLCGILAGLLFVTAAFYTYTGIVGRNLGAVNILLFLIGCVIVYYVSYANIRNTGKISKMCDVGAFAALIILACLFCIYSFNPPFFGIFTVPDFGAAQRYNPGLLIAESVKCR